MYNCPKCNSPFELGIKFCQTCGYELGDKFLRDPTCPVCKQEFSAGTRFCDKDGSSLVAKDKLIPSCVKCGKIYPDTVKFCPDDGGMLIAEAYRTQTSRQDIPNTSAVSSSQFPTLEQKLNQQFTWYTWLFWGGAATAIFGIGIFAIVAAFIIGLVIQHKAWSLIQSASPRTTPGMAIGLQFVPLFQFYWYVTAYHGLSQDINKYIELNKLSASKMNETIGLATAILFCSPSVFIPLVVVIGWNMSNDDTVRAYFGMLGMLLYMLGIIAVFVMSFIFTRELKNTLVAIVREQSL